MKQKALLKTLVIHLLKVDILEYNTPLEVAQNVPVNPVAAHLAARSVLLRHPETDLGTA